MTATSKRIRNHINSENKTVDPSFPVRPLKITLCPPEFQHLQKVMRGEPESATYIIQGYIAEGLQTRGHTLTFLAPRSTEQIVCTSDIRKPQRAPQTWSAGGWFQIFRKVSWRVQRWLGVPYLNVFSNYLLYDTCLRCLPGQDLVYERNGLFKYGVAMACKRLKVPYLLYLEADEILEHDIMGTPITGLLRWRAKYAMRYNLHAADCIVCVSEPLVKHLVDVWKVPANKMVVFPNVADIQRFRPDPLAAAEVRTSIGIEANPLVIFVGNFYKWHDVGSLLEAFAQLSKTYPDARLILAGDGAQRKTMMQRSAELGLSETVRFTGLLPHGEVPRLLAAADIAVVPYPPMEIGLWLSPLKLFEYMASGTAIIASAIGQLKEIIQDGRNGMLVPPGDVSALAVALGRLINDPDLRNRLGGQAREDVKQRHSWEQYLSRLERLFLGAINGQPVDQI